ncbi:hypothetical protein FGB62_211g023 [Gracilaria domingensis]|nr:hypothetical protein FGB62_211g023 [Gracilaria domingensis]
MTSVGHLPTQQHLERTPGIVSLQTLMPPVVPPHATTTFSGRFSSALHRMPHLRIPSIGPTPVSKGSALPEAHWSTTLKVVPAGDQAVIRFTDDANFGDVDDDDDRVLIFHGDEEEGTTEVVEGDKFKEGIGTIWLSVEGNGMGNNICVCARFAVDEDVCVNAFLLWVVQVDELRGDGGIVRPSPIRHNATCVLSASDGDVGIESSRNRRACDAERWTNYKIVQVTNKLQAVNGLNDGATIARKLSKTTCAKCKNREGVI